MSCYSARIMEAWTVRRIVAWMQADFERRGIDNARLDADLLVAEALGVKRIVLFMDPERPLIEAELTKVRALVERRRAHEPIAYILGEREFYGRPFTVTRDVLIPRPDTETLVEAASEFLKQGAPLGRVLDLCTGSGAIAVSLAAERLERALVASDLSPAALAIAQQNAERHGVLERVELRQGDLFDVLGPDERFACVTINPPYIAASELATLQADVRDFEPRMALDAGSDALSFYRRIALAVGAHLEAGAGVFVEVGFGQAADVRALFEAQGFTGVHALRDLAGIERVVRAVQPG
ncbi:MAG: putative N(5)-glutamine methyltransferase PrmC [Myxococcaceae bacterium]|nr:putative N(5)-glutamine methyltransferase PrmC [Myxococcaceae bacterium]